MLESLRKWASGWVAFFFISILILSFGIWGISSYITGGRGGNALATVGDKEITAQEYQRAFGNELAALSRRAGQQISHEQARAVGLDSRVLSQLIGSTAIEAHAENLGLALSDAAVAAGLEKDPNFQNAGKFDRNLVLRLQQELGVTERGLLELRRKDELTSQITSALLRATVVPDEMVDSLADWRGETRVISYFTIDLNKLPQPPEPTDEQLKKTYNDNHRRFMSEPRRDLSVLQLSIADLKKKADIPEAEIRDAYEKTKQSYEVPEKRRIEQIAFQDTAAAQKALADIKAGKDFLEVAKENQATESDVKLGLKTRKDLIDPKIAEAAFSLAKEQVSEVIEGAFATVIVRVTEIEPGRSPSFEEVRDKVSDRLATEWANAKLQEYYGLVDDGRAEGKPLKQIAADLDLPFFDLKQVTRGNVGEDGKPALTVPDATTIINEGFRAEIGLESEPVQLADGGYAWVDVTKITEPTLPPFEEVKEEVKRFWTEEKKRTNLVDAAKSFVERLNAGEDFAKIAAEAGGNVQTTAAVGRSTIPDGLSQLAVTHAFSLRKGNFASAETSDGTSRIVFRVDEINKAPNSSVELKQQLKNEILQQLRADTIAAYVTALQERLGVEINQALFRRLTGADQQ
jgi:peptidyl-prolyl cis-trans isomerase D